MKNETQRPNDNRREPQALSVHSPRRSLLCRSRPPYRRFGSKIAVFLGLVVLLLGPTPGHAADPPLERFTFEEPHMGTKFRLVLFAENRVSAQRAAQAAFTRVAALNRIMSDYDADSELMRLCRHFATNTFEPMPVSADLFTVLAKGQAVARMSGGAFDMSIGPLVQLWRQSRRTQKLPTADEVARAKRRVGFEKIELSETNRTVRLKTPGMQLDLGGIAKGFAADEMLVVLKKHGIARALASAGGDVAVSAPPPDATGWKVDIAPLAKAKPELSLRLSYAAVSTSGDSQQFVLIDGVRYSHIVDPKTGLGLTGRRSVTVIAPNGITSDCMTKAVMLMDSAPAFALIEKTPNVAALIITVDTTGKEVSTRSQRFEEYLAK